MEERVKALRAVHPRWGGRKLHHALLRQGVASPPSPSTITAILRRHGLLRISGEVAAGAWQRFERGEPNELWQMDFKGHVPCPEGRCHPLDVLDDCTRYLVLLDACGDEKGATVQGGLTKAFKCYGLPWQMLMDNGSPWGYHSGDTYTSLGVWLMRLGIRISHGRPYHPQTQGKLERFHRSFKAELLGDSVPWKQPECQRRFDEWRVAYNWKRPHEALEMGVPGEHYRPSARPFPSKLPPIEYGPDDIIRKAQDKGLIAFRGRSFRISKAFRGQPVALRPDPDNDGKYHVYFCRQKIATIDLHDGTVKSDV